MTARVAVETGSLNTREPVALYRRAGKSLRNVNRRPREQARAVIERSPRCAAGASQLKPTAEQKCLFGASTGGFRLTCERWHLTLPAHDPWQF